MRELSAKDKAFLNERQKLLSRISKTEEEKLDLLKTLSEKEAIISKQEQKVKDLEEVISKYLEGTDIKPEELVADMKKTETAKTLLIKMFEKTNLY